MHCRRFLDPGMSRRELLLRCPSGFGALRPGRTPARAGVRGGHRRRPGCPHAGNPDPAPASRGEGPLGDLPVHGRRPVAGRYLRSQAAAGPRARPSRSRSRRIRRSSTTSGTCCDRPWKFRRYGESGIPVSDLFPHVGRCVDDLAIVRSMVSNFSEHTSANYFLHTGSGLQGRPSHGAWVTYGLGSECQDLPGFVVLNGGLIPPGGIDCFNSGFLPAAYQGSIFKPDRAADRQHHAHRAGRRPTSGASSTCSARSTGACWAGWAITTAWKPRSPITSWPSGCRPSVPELVDLDGESAATRAALRPGRSLSARRGSTPASA